MAAVTRDEAITVIREAATEPLASRIVASLRPSIRIRAEKAAVGDIEIGASRLGGDPDVPQDFEWPQWNTELEGYDHEARRPFKRPAEDRPLAFLAQIHMPEVALLDEERVLPHSGWLYFFYDVEAGPWGFDPKDRGAWRVIYAPDDRASLKRMQRPESFQPWGPFDACTLTFSREWTVDNELLEEDSEQIFTTLAAGTEWGGVHHRLLGQPQTVQNPMEEECQLASHGLYCGDASGYAEGRRLNLREGAKDWILLLQLDTDEENPGWMWGDGGRIYFWIRKQDLQARDFSKCWMILQCY